MLLSEIEAKIAAVLKSLSDTPRNTYEVDNLYRLNCERITSVRTGLADMSGEYVDALKARCNEAERQAEAKHAAGVAGSAPVDNAFSLDFEMEEAEEANAAELELAKSAAGVSKRSSKKSGVKSKGKKSKGGEKVDQQKDERTLVSSPCPPSLPPVSSANQPDNTEKAASTSAQPTWTVLDRREDLASSDLPTVLATSGRGRCEPISNSPLARLFFTEKVDWDGTACQCAVELYRCVVIAMTYGEPQLNWAEFQKVVQAKLATGVSTGKGTVPKNAAVANDAEVTRINSAEHQDGGAEEEKANDDEEMPEEDLTLSEKLIAEYEQAQLAEAEQDLDSSSLPHDVTETLQQRLRTFTDDIWVVLLCHGGYFAGGVFIRGKSVLHKAFQRYVVRKKQGCKQSSNAKDVGSYNSVGSQIRAAQEVKWRADVRDILLKWTPYIQAAAFVLYAAPGPQNRTVLTDFSSLPPVAGLGGGKGVSPIQLKDPRVSRVPITTHRPSFEEVQRIYSVCAHCTLLYVKDEETD